MGHIHVMLIQLIREDASQEAFYKSFVVFIKVCICLINVPQHTTENRLLKEIASTESWWKPK